MTLWKRLGLRSLVFLWGVGVQVDHTESPSLLSQLFGFFMTFLLAYFVINRRVVTMLTLGQISQKESGFKAVQIKIKKKGASILIYE